MKPHKHAALIKAWADGAEIQYCYSDVNRCWADAFSPSWCWDIKYRIKPREFETGAFYPVTLELGLRFIATYRGNDNFYLPGPSGTYSIDELTWIGDKLEIDWPK